MDTRRSESHIDNNSHSQHQQSKQPIVLDNDVEKFKIRLENMLSTFKLESINEIVETKKALLFEQTRAIANEKQIFNTTLSKLDEDVW